MRILEKLNKIQAELKAPKGQMNKFGNYRYRSCEDILESTKPLLQETKTALTLNDELVQIGERYYVKATACLHDTESDENIHIQALAREEEVKKGMDSSQITGAASSYARKYALNGLLAIDDTKDSDATNNHGKETQPEVPKTTKPETIDKVKVKEINEMIDKTKTDVAKFCAHFKIKGVYELTDRQFDTAMKMLEKK